MKNSLILFSFLSLISILKADDKQLGKLGKQRTCFDVKHYSIAVNVHPVSKSITGSNTIQAVFVEESRMIQIDYVQKMKISEIKLQNGHDLKYYRKGRAVLIELDRIYKKGEVIKFKVSFMGQPEVAKKAPWQGGFVWSKDKDGNDWIGLACESKGASIWLPCKDHWNDEPDSLDMHLGVPKGLMGVSNGRLMGNTSISDSMVVYHWRTSNTINHYNISINIGKYAHIKDVYNGKEGALSLDYYVLAYNASKAIKHFRETDTMLRIFEHFFGPYPFYSDGYKLVETPYWGMEHQSCIAYGNNYKFNKFGFDFIIVHESGHEWFANSITASDPADMWIHESFTTYSEALFVEYTKGIDSAISYLSMQRKLIVSRYPIQGTRNIDLHHRKDNDIYYKGTWVLHTLRNHFGNDSIWMDILYGIGSTFRHKIIRTEDVTNYINKASGLNLEPFWKQYLYGTKLPVLHVKMGKSMSESYIEWYLSKVETNFQLNLKLSPDRILQADSKPRRLALDGELSVFDFKRLESLYLIKVEIEL